MDLMMGDPLGDGWLGKLIAAAIAATVAWFARRPAERAAVLIAVDTRVGTLLDHLEAEVKRATARCDEVETVMRAERARCEEELAELRAEISALMQGAVPLYEMRAPPKGRK